MAPSAAAITGQVLGKVRELRKPWLGKEVFVGKSPRAQAARELGPGGAHAPGEGGQPRDREQRPWGGAAQRDRDGGGTALERGRGEPVSLPPGWEWEAGPIMAGEENLLEEYGREEE